MEQISDEFRQMCAYAPAVMVSALVDLIPYPLIVRDMSSEIVLANTAARDEFAADLLHCKCYDVVGYCECFAGDYPARQAMETGQPV